MYQLRAITKILTSTDIYMASDWKAILRINTHILTKKLYVFPIKGFSNFNTKTIFLESMPFSNRTFGLTITPQIELFFTLFTNCLALIGFSTGRTQRHRKQPAQDCRWSDESTFSVVLTKNFPNTSF